MKIQLIFNSNDPVLNYAATEFCHHLTLLNMKLSFLSNPSMPAACDHTIQFQIKKELAECGAASDNDSTLDDNYQIQIKEGNGIIEGSNSRSILLGVYAYLKKIGFRFLLPGKNGTVVPSLTDFQQLNADFYARASYRHRGVCIEGANSIENVCDFIDWLPKLGFNSFFVQFKFPYIFFKRWYSHTFNPLPEEEDFDQKDLESFCKVIQSEMQKRGLLLHAVGHGWTCEAIGLPSVGWISAKETPFDERYRPYLAQLNGKRDFFGNTPLNTNLCYSNPNVLESLCDCVLAYAQENPAVNYLHIWLADEPNNICECSDCMAFAPSDQYVRLLNLIDQKLTEKGLSTKIVFLLYQELLYAPLTEHFKNNSRFTLMFAPISRTFEKPYPKQFETIALPEYRRNHITLPVTIDENVSYLRAWQSHFQGDSFVYDYPLGRAHYGDFGYVHIAKIISEDIKTLKTLNLNGYISCQELRAAFPNALPNYVMGYTLFDSTLSFDELAHEYYQAAYGEAGTERYHYLQKISSLSSCDYFNGKYSRNHPAFSQNCTMILETLYDFAKLPKAKPCNETQTIFSQLLDYHNESSILLVKALQKLSSGDTLQADMFYAEFCALIRSKEPAFQPYLDVYRMIEVSTKYTGFHLTT